MGSVIFQLAVGTQSRNISACSLFCTVFLPTKNNRELLVSKVRAKDRVCFWLRVGVRAITNKTFKHGGLKRPWKHGKRLAVVLLSDKGASIAHREIEVAKSLYVATANWSDNVRSNVGTTTAKAGDCP